MKRFRKAYLEVRFVVDDFYVGGTADKPIKIKLPKEFLQKAME